MLGAMLAFIRSEDQTQPVPNLDKNTNLNPKTQKLFSYAAFNTTNSTTLAHTDKIHINLYQHNSNKGKVNDSSPIKIQIRFTTPKLKKPGTSFFSPFFVFPLYSIPISDTESDTDRLIHYTLNPHRIFIGYIINLY